MALLCALGVASALAGCRDATQARVIVRTNVPYRPGVNLAVWATSRATSAADAPVSTSEEPWLDDGALGDLVVTPPGRTDDALHLQIVLGLGRSAASCSATDAKGCIVARRRLAFVPHTGLRVPVVLHLACDSVVCDQDSTCNYLGKCVSAAVDAAACASAEGCVLPGDETPAIVPLDGGRAADADAADAPFDAGPPGVPVDLASGFGHSCVRLEDGRTKCWGANQSPLGLGDLRGRGGAPNEMGAKLPALDLGPGRTALRLGLGRDHSCAVLDNGQVKCWGKNGSGELGLGDSLTRGQVPNQMGAALPAVDLGPGRTATAVALGHNHTCALLDTREVKCWGANQEGQLGLGDNVARGLLPGQMGAALPVVDLGQGRAVLELGARAGHTCARLDDGSLKCWGRNGTGQLGLGDPLSRGAGPNDMGLLLPTVDLGPGRSASALAVGESHTCALLDNAQVKCWGANQHGTLGLEGGTRGAAPGQMGANLPALDLGTARTARSIAVGWIHTCVVLDDGTGKCWGFNDSGQLGLGDALARGAGAAQMGDSLPSIDLGPGPRPLRFSAGYRNTCALLEGNRVKCWGQGAQGPNGIGDQITRGDAPGEMGVNLPFLEF